jgi:hypothetical protein
MYFPINTQESTVERMVCPTCVLPLSSASPYNLIMIGQFLRVSGMRSRTSNKFHAITMTITDELVLSDKWNTSTPVSF